MLGPTLAVVCVNTSLQVVKNPNNDYILLNAGKSWTSVARAICNELDCDVDARNPGTRALANL